MTDIKHQIFISSTYNDLIEERQAAVEAVLRAGHIPAGMELFTAHDRSQMEVITAWIDESDIFVLILGSRYGSIESHSGHSYTETEYRYAQDQSKPTLTLVLSDVLIDSKIKKLRSKATDAPEKVKTFREYAMTNRMVNPRKASPPLAHSPRSSKIPITLHPKKQNILSWTRSLSTEQISQ